MSQVNSVITNHSATVPITTAPLSSQVDYPARDNHIAGLLTHGSKRWKTWSLVQGICLNKFDTIAGFFSLVLYTSRNHICTLNLRNYLALVQSFENGIAGCHF